MQVTTPTLLTMRPSPRHQSHTSIQKATGPSTITKAICVVQRLLAPNPTPPHAQTSLPLSLECGAVGCKGWETDACSRAM